MGEAKRRSNVAVRDAIEALAVDTVGGRVQVRWNTHRAATPFGQLAFFVEFLNLTGLYRRYAHIAALRADAISPQLLGLSTVVSEDTVRRALSAIDEAAGRTWMQTPWTPASGHC